MIGLEFSPRRYAFSVVVGSLVALAPRVSAGQTLLNTDVAWPGRTQDDVDRMHAAAARLYAGRSIGTVERWRSPDSKDAGEVKLVQSFTAHAMPCRTLDYTIRGYTRQTQPLCYKLVHGLRRLMEDS